MAENVENRQCMGYSSMGYPKGAKQHATFVSEEAAENISLFETLWPVIRRVALIASHDTAVDTAH